jgi:5-amino-6-(5-phosphoribosylamino)uracil reductase
MFIRSNLAISLDGKIATSSREFFPLGTPEDLRMMQIIRKKSDAILMGASTLRTFKLPLLIRGSEKQPLNVVLSHSLEGVSPRWKFFTEPSIRRVLFVIAKLSPSRRRAFERTSEFVTLDKPTRKNTSARQIVRELESRGIRHLLVEGGGSVMWDFVSQNLIDEYYVTLTPRLLGGTEAPTLVDGAGFAPNAVVNLRLAKMRRVGNEIYLVYRKTAKRGR